MVIEGIQVEAVIRALGGQDATVSSAARAIGVPVSTALSWLKAGRIPSWRWPSIEAAAARLDVTLPVGQQPAPAGTETEVAA